MLSIVNKKILVVGNGSSSTKTKLDETYDIIVRFDDYKIDGYEQYIGEQTDIWCVNANYQKNLKRIKNGNKKALVLFCGLVTPNNIKLISKYKKAGYKIDHIHKVHEETKAFYTKGKKPTIGIICIRYLFTICKNCSIHLKGFDILTSPQQGHKNYWWEDNQQHTGWKHHSPFQEKEHFKVIKKQTKLNNGNKVIMT